MTLSIALLGAGRIGRARVAAIARVPGARLVAVSDVATPRRRRPPTSAAWTCVAP